MVSDPTSLARPTRRSTTPAPGWRQNSKGEKSADFWLTENCRLLLSALLQNLLGDEVAHLGAVGQGFKICGLEELFLCIVQRLVNCLLHAWIAQLPLACRLARNQLVDGVSSNLVSWGRVIVNRDHVGELFRLELADGIVKWRIGLELRFPRKSHVAAVRAGVRIF